MRISFFEYFVQVVEVRLDVRPAFPSEWAKDAMFPSLGWELIGIINAECLCLERWPGFLGLGEDRLDHRPLVVVVADVDADFWRARTPWGLPPVSQA